MSIQQRYGIAILDNDPFTLEGLEMILGNETGIRVLWTSCAPTETVSRCLDPETRPDVLLMDMSLGEKESGAWVCRRIRKRTSAVPILAMTAFSLDYYIKDASLSGAQGIVAKTDRAGMRHAIRTIASGGTWGPMFDTTTIAHIRLENQPTRKLLTGRESEAMNLAATGLRLRDVATRMNVSESTVKTLIAKAKSKLGATSLREAVAIWTGEADV